MSLNRKLGLFVLCVTLLPLALVGALVVRVAENALRERILEAQSLEARAEAQRIGAFVEDRADALRAAAATFQLGRASEDERIGAARFLYRVDDAVVAVALVGPDGRLLAAPAFVEGAVQDAALDRHPRTTRQDVDKMIARAPLAPALAQGAGAVVLSDVYAASTHGATAMSLALPVAGEPDSPLVFLVELSLASLAGQAREGRDLALLDAESRIIAHADPRRLTTIETASRATERGRLLSRAPVPVAGLGWTVSSSIDESVAFAPVHRMRLALGATLVVVLVLLLAVSFAFVGSVRRALDAVVGGAEAFARGALEHKIAPVPRERELRELALTFNRMGDELLGARRKLETWNVELERTVELRTRELRDAQAKLLETRKLAAVGQLGAGVAHEINNPLATVLGTAQNFLLRKKKSGASDEDPEVQAMQKVERAAKRCRDVTQTLLRFSQRSTDASRAPVMLRRVVEDAVALTRAAVEGAGHSLVVDTPSAAGADVVVLGDAHELTQVAVHLVHNARTALQNKPQGTVRVRWDRQEGAAVIEVSDDGKGIDPSIRDRIFEPFFTTKDVWQNLGLGLSESFRIVEDHGGRFEVETEVGVGTTMRVVLPLTIEARPT